MLIDSPGDASALVLFVDSDDTAETSWLNCRHDARGRCDRVIVLTRVQRREPAARGPVAHRAVLLQRV